ncbi:DUF2812 domain-containing protein [Viridibacillus sp. YIM B01967]|uniref:DUF2812 domain-containing protein n=1 Tax=Viridibacillus soli TaxID=2798301 RepID=A0ABS1H4D3_9BACL|nr:DUF2812 domain-containing protein [Viridibacillus soli]MBK3494235.1 DUF2812 domain-containing protein [Viridibacillus soli]
MKQSTKYMMSDGLAFSEKRDLKRLQKKSKEGWHLFSFLPMGYNLQKGEPKELQYSVDYRHLQDGEDQEYFELFEMAGWNHVCSEVGIHFFVAPMGTQPIYTDVESQIDKVQRLSKNVYMTAVFFVLMTVVSYFVSELTTGIVSSIFHYILLASEVFTIPCLMMVASLLYRKWVKKS